MNQIYKHIALTLKTLRRERGWSLDKAAEETGVSKAMLGQIEREESSPTVATLWKIANGFQISFSYFLENLPQPQGSLYRFGESHTLIPLGEKFHVMPLFPFDHQLSCEIFVIELLPYCEQLSAPHNPGVIEHVIVVRGTIDVLLQGSWKTLHQGEGIRFDAGHSHGYRNITTETACFHNLIHYPPQR